MKQYSSCCSCCCADVNIILVICCHSCWFWEIKKKSMYNVPTCNILHTYRFSLFHFLETSSERLTHPTRHEHLTLMFLSSPHDNNRLRGNSNWKWCGREKKAFCTDCVAKNSQLTTHDSFKWKCEWKSTDFTCQCRVIYKVQSHFPHKTW